MIKNSPDLINAPTGGANDDFTPLGRAASKGQLRVAQFLLDSGAEVNRAYNVRTPLLLAAGRGHKAMIELLLARGADVNARNENGQTGLHIAAQNGFQATAEALVAGKADVNVRTTKQKDTPLHQAVGAGHVAMVKFLLAKGADADAQSASGTTALMLVANRVSLEVLQVLLAAGAKPNLASESGFTALSIAAEKNNLEAVKALLAAKADPNGDAYCPLTLAIHAKATEVLRALLEAGADANRAWHITWQVQVGSRGRLTTYGSGTDVPLVTPLFVAIDEGNADAVKLLLAHKADPNSLGPDRLPLILQAARKPAVLEALLAVGAKPNVDDGEGRTPLYIATEAGFAESVRLLLAHGADKEIRPFGYTPLLFAVGNGKQKTAEVLLQGGADVNAHATVDGRTALHLAIERRDPALTALLLTNKADVNAQDKRGLTPLDIAKGNASAPPPGMPPGVPTPFPPMQPVRVQPPGGTPATPAPVASPTSLADLLRQHGALDELPDFTTIRVTRQGLDKPILVFRQQTSGWNHFTLLETVLNLYVNQGAVDFERADAARSGRNLAPGSSFQSRLQSVISQASAQGNAVWFPDLKRIIIHRPDRTPGGKEQVIPVNLLNATNGVDCTKDLPLEFGDVVEIPVRDHALSESPSALSLPETVGFLDCLRRKVQLTVRGQSREIELRPSGAESSLRMALGKSEAKSQLLSSSDLTRVKVTRQDPATGQPREFVVDATKANAEYDDLWLRDGDIIEVPEK
jgi:ankyrin repeat protein